MRVREAARSRARSAIGRRVKCADWRGELPRRWDGPTLCRETPTETASRRRVNHAAHPPRGRNWPASAPELARSLACECVPAARSSSSSVHPYVQTATWAGRCCAAAAAAAVLCGCALRACGVLIMTGGGRPAACHSGAVPCSSSMRRPRNELGDRSGKSRLPKQLAWRTTQQEGRAHAATSCHTPHVHWQI
jgi:hypothetical protein